MKNNPILELVIVTLFGVLVLTTAWEFLLEPMVGSANEAETETLHEKLEFILTGLLSAGLAMIYPMILLRRSMARRERAEADLRESERRFRVFSDNSPVLFSLKDAEGRYVFVNEQWEKIVGLSSEGVRGKAPKDVLPEVMASISTRLDEEAIKAKEVIEKEVKYPLSDGEHTFLTTKFPVFNDDESFVGFGTVGIDITERKHVVDALQESEKRLRLFTDSMPVLFSYVDKDRRYRYCNLTYEKRFQRKREDIIGLTVEELLGSESYLQVKPVLDRALSGETVFYEQWVDYAVSGRTFISGSLIPDISPDDGEVIGFFAWIQDITGKKRDADTLARAKDIAENASASKSRFMAAASHDLRQPMQALAMFVDVLSGQPHDKDTSEIVEKIQASSKSLQSLLNSLLDISKLEADLIEPAVRPFSIGELTSQLAEEIEPLAKKKGLRLVHVGSDIPVRSDPGLLNRILRNLLTNAVDNTDSGRIVFGCRRRGATLSIEVWDTGPGIPESQRTRIFEEFYQGNPANGKTRGGLGLGLTIVDRLVKMLRHRVEVSSGALGGSVFRVFVPVSKPGAEKFEEARKVKRQDPAPGALVVGIDDDPTVRDAMNLLLESWGFNSVTASSAKEAMQRLAEEERSPDLIIADYQLDQGEKGSRAIRDIQNQLGEEIPGLLLTGDIEPGQLKEAAESGFKVIQKPIQPDMLKAEVAEKIESHDQGASPNGPRRKLG